MSKTVDQKVVEMRFDNKNFEANVKTSMTTLEKLKQSLKFKGASEGIENINKASKKVNFSSMEKSLSSLEKRFSVSGIAINRIIENFVDKGLTSLSKFAQKTTAWFSQGIMQGGKNRATNLENANFQLQGLLKDGDKVSAVMKNVSDSVDGTAYSLDAAASVASQLAASGMEAGDEMSSALRGVAGVAAMTNSEYSDIGRIYTQVAGQGRLMGDQLLQLSGRGMNAAATLASYLGKTEAEVRDMVSKGEIDFKTFAAAMDDAFGEHAKKANETFSGSMSNVRAALGRIGADFYAPLIKQNGPLVQLFNALRERINDVHTAIKPLTEAFADVTSKVIYAVANFVKLQAVTDKVKSVFDTVKTAVDSVSKTVSKAAEPVKAASESIAKVTDAVADLGTVVDDVILGKFGNGQERFDALTKSGYNWCEVQNRVNETLGNSYRYTQDQIDAQNKLLGVQTKSTEAVSNASKETKELNGDQKEQIKQLAKLNDEQLKSKGLTKDQIEAFKELRKMAGKLGISVDELIDNMDEMDGKWIFLDSVKNIGSGLLKIFKAVGQAFKEIFKPLENDTVFNAVAGFHKFSEALNISDKTAQKITDTFKGLFSIIHLVTSIVGGTFKIAFTIINKVLDSFGINLLDVTAFLGRAITKFHDFILQNSLVKGAINGAVDAVVWLIKTIQDLYKAFMKLPIVQKTIKQIKNAFDELKKIDLKSIGKNIISGLKKGLSGGFSSVITGIVNLGTKLINAFKDLLGIHSPSRVFFEFGSNIVEGLVNGIKAGIKWVVDGVKLLAKKVVDAFASIDVDINFDKIKTALSNFVEYVKGIDFKALLGIIPIAAILLFAKKIYDVANILAQGITAVNNVINGFAGIEKSVANVINGYAGSFKTKNLKRIAESIAILVGCVVALTLVDQNKLYDAVTIVGLLSLIMIGLAKAMDMMGSSAGSIEKGKVSIEGVKTGLIAIGGAIALMALSVKLIGELNPEQAEKGYLGVAGIAGAIGILMLAMVELSNKAKPKQIKNAGKIILSVSAAILIMSIAAKKIGGMSWPDMGKAAIFMAGYLAFIALLVKVATIDKGQKIAKIGRTLLAISIAMQLMAITVKLIGLLKVGEILKGAAFMAGFVLFIKALVKVTTVGKESETAKLTGLLISIAFSMTLMVGVCKLVGLLNADDIKKGIAFAAAFCLLIKAIIKVSTVGSDSEIAKIAGTILAFSLALAVMAATSILMSMMSLEGLAKGVTAVAILGLVMAQMVKAAQGVKDCKKELTVMTVAITILVAAAALLSLLDPARLAVSVGAISLMMGAFALMEKSAKDLKGAEKSLVVLTGVVAILATLLHTMSALDVKNSLSNSAALSLLMLSLTASMKIISKTKKLGTDSVKSLAIMTVVVGALAGILYLVKGMDPTSTLATATGLSEMVLALSAAVLILGQVKTVSTKALVAAGILTLVMAALAGVLYLVDGLDPASSIGTATALSTLILALSEATLILSVAGLAAAAAIAGAASLVGVIAIIGGLIAALAALNTYIPGLEEFLDKGIAILSKIGYGIGEFVGNLIAGVASGVMNILPAFGESLSAFMVGLQPFITLAKQIDGDVLAGISMLTLAIVELCAAKLLDGITSFLTLGGSFSELGKQLMEFATYLLPFASTMKMIDDDVVDAAMNIAEMIMALTVSELIDGIMSFLGGGADFEEFGEKLVQFGEGVVAFSQTLSDGGGINVEAVNAAAEAGKAMAKLQDCIAPMGGLVDLIKGHPELGEFGKEIQTYATALKDASVALTADGGGLAINPSYIDAAAEAGKGMAKLQGAIEPINTCAKTILNGKAKLGTFGEDIHAYADALKEASDALTNDAGGLAITPDYIQAAVDAGSAMAKLQGAIKPIDGLAGLIKGHASLETFGEDISAYGTALAAASDSLTTKGGGSVINTAAIQVAADAGTLMAELQEAIPEDHWFDGKVDLDDFGSKIEGFGEGLSDFSDSVKDVDSGKIYSSVSAANTLVNLTKTIVDLDVSGIPIFKSSINNIALAIKSYYDSLKDVDAGVVKNTVSSAVTLKTLINDLLDVDPSGVENFKIDSIATELQAYANNLSDFDPFSVITSIGAAENLRDFIVSLTGFDGSGVTTFATAISDLSEIQINDLVTNFSNAAEQLNTVGQNLMTNLIGGITGKQGEIVAAFTTMMSAIGMTVIMSASIITGAFDAMMNAVSLTITSRQAVFVMAGTMLMTGLGLGMITGSATAITSITTVITVLTTTIKSKTSTFKTAGSSLMSSGLIAGIKSQAGGVSSAATSSLGSAVTAIRQYYKSFSDAGEYLGWGLINGMESKKQSAYQKGYELGQISAQGVKDGAKEKSPSKLTTQYGMYIGEGLINGMASMLSSVYETGTAMGKGAATSIYSAFNASDRISGMDYHPSIAPIVDLSDVDQGRFQFGADINASFISGPIASLQQIVTDAQNEINASNEEVIKAVNGLRDDLNLYYSADDKEIALYVDSKKMASTLAKPMNRQLLTLQKRGAY